VTLGEKGRLNVKIYEHLLREDIELSPDLLVLSVATLPQPDNDVIGKMLKVPLNKDGFFLEAHMKLRPVDFATEGVFLCGMAHSPKFIDESISQACGAAARACTILTKEKLEAEGIIAVVNEDICNGCGICIPTCEYKAIEVIDNPDDPEKKLVRVNEGLCKGCGACVGACPSAAMEQKGFRSSQIMAMIDAALGEMEEEVA